MAAEFCQEVESWGSVPTSPPRDEKLKEFVYSMAQGNSLLGNILCLAFSFFFPCRSCSTPYRILKYSLGQREQLYIMVSRPYRGESLSWIFQYYKQGRTYSIRGIEKTFPLSPSCTGEYQSPTWGLFLGSPGGLRSRLADEETETFFFAFWMSPCQMNYWKTGDRWLFNQLIYLYVSLFLFCLSPSRMTSSSWLLEQF